MSPELKRRHRETGWGRVRKAGLRKYELDYPNCIGFVYHKLGLVSDEKFINIGPLEPHLNFFEETEESSKADAVAVLSLKFGAKAVIHMAVMDKKDPQYVLERPVTGGPIRRAEFGDSISPYLSEACKAGGGDIKFLKLKKV